ncbi:SMP-30/gluconolactonase/LRE family protein [Nevskia sp.]|uniref:SMP-30/gluconolactonase/LRE family protein n=1 Tax=Nevskia sp. TaxID=1929292 RepID=UPI0025EE1233|nr:SMP-30/gluconolactonase/LRE family protein [Nevskia sp.]
MKKLLLALLLGFVLALLFLWLKPTVVDPVAWVAPVAPKLEGPYAPNTILKDAQRLLLGVGLGPEGVAVDASGAIYVGYEDGRIVRLAPEGNRYREVANTGGRPLGIVAEADGSLLVADADRGLLSIDPKGVIIPLSQSAGAVPLGFTDDVDHRAGDTLAFFTDASTKFPNPHYLLDILEHRPHGRVIVQDLARQQSAVLFEDLYFANGIAVGPDGAWLLVAESGAYRITRFWLKGPKAGSREVFADNLPGFPDNLSFNGRDRIWVALPSVRDPALDALSPWPGVRRMLANLPAPLQNLLGFHGTPHAFVLGFDLDGKLIANLQYQADDAYAPIMSVEEHGPWLYFGSLSQPSIARLPLELAVPGSAPPPGGWRQTLAVPTRGD